MRRITIPLLLAVLSLLSPGPVEAASDDPLSAVQGVLDVRAVAVRTGNREAFLATIDAQAPVGFREAQGRLFDGLRTLPLASYALTARTADTGDLATGTAGRYGASRVFLPETRQIYRLEGYDDRDAVEVLWLTFVERGRRWYVASDSDLEALGLESSHQLWDAGPVRLKRTEHFLVMSHPEQSARADALTGIAEEGMAELARIWDQPWSGRIPLVLPGSVQELQRILQSTADLDKFVAFVSYGALDENGFEVTAPRIFIQDERLGTYGRAFQVSTLVHELSHAAAAPLVGPFVPSWVHEGVAEWLSSGRPPNQRRPRGGDGQLPRDYEFSTGSADAILRAYGESRAAVSMLAAANGPGAPSAFLRALGEARVEPGSTDYRVDVALRRVAATGLDDLQARWAGR